MILRNTNRRVRTAFNTSQTRQGAASRRGAVALSYGGAVLSAPPFLLSHAGRLPSRHPHLFSPRRAFLIQRMYLPSPLDFSAGSGRLTSRAAGAAICYRAAVAGKGIATAAELMSCAAWENQSLAGVNVIRTLNVIQRGQSRKRHTERAGNGSELPTGLHVTSNCTCRR